MTTGENKMNKRFTITAIILLGIVLLAACTSPQPPTVSSNADTNTSAQDAGTAKLNLNTVTGDELLAAIPDFPNRMVREFQEYRPYISILQFRREIGKYVEDAQVAEYEKYVYVPILYNSSDAETLQQIPGLDAANADALISARPFSSQDIFLAKLSEYVSTDELEIAKSYLGEN
jgi:DNA uptake protein ComE-like DNA-binding protein